MWPPSWMPGKAIAIWDWRKESGLCSSSYRASRRQISSKLWTAFGRCCRFCGLPFRLRSNWTWPRTAPQTIRASVHDVEVSLIISVVLVVLVVFVFLRNAWATAIPSVAVPLSLVGTFGVMYLAGLYHRQPLADGAHDLHRLRRGRCHRGDRKHHALSRAGTHGHGSRAKGLGRRSASRSSR